MRIPAELHSWNLRKPYFFLYLRKRFFFSLEDNLELEVLGLRLASGEANPEQGELQELLELTDTESDFSSIWITQNFSERRRTP